MPRRTIFPKIVGHREEHGRREFLLQWTQDGETWWLPEHVVCNNNNALLEAYLDKNALPVTRNWNSAKGFC
jgi:hypothetical protein